MESVSIGESFAARESAVLAFAGVLLSDLFPASRGHRSTIRQPRTPDSIPARDYRKDHGRSKAVPGSPRPAHRPRTLATAAIRALICSLVIFLSKYSPAGASRYSFRRAADTISDASLNTLRNATSGIPPKTRPEIRTLVSTFGLDGQLSLSLNGFGARPFRHR